MEIQVFRNENSSQANAYSHYSSYSYSGLIPNERAPSSSADRARVRCLGSHGFEFCRGLRFSFAPGSYQVDQFTFNISLHFTSDTSTSSNASNRDGPSEKRNSTRTQAQAKSSELSKLFRREVMGPVISPAKHNHEWKITLCLCYT